MSTGILWKKPLTGIMGVAILHPVDNGRGKNMATDEKPGEEMKAAFEVWWKALPAETRLLIDRTSALIGYMGGVQHGCDMAAAIIGKVLA